MTTVSLKFAVFNPKDGTTTMYSSKDDAVKKIIEQMMAMYNEHVHDKMYSLVQINEDGSQTWGLPDVEFELTKQEVIDKIKNKLFIIIN